MALTSSCANCKSVFKGEDMTSFLQNFVFSDADMDEDLTVIEVLAELFECSDKLRCLLDNVEDERDVPFLCQMCLRLVGTVYEAKKQFLTLCHQQGILRPILMEPKIENVKEVETRHILEDKLYSKLKLKKCHVVIRPLPFLYDGVSTSTLLTKIKIETVDEEMEGFDFDDYMSTCDDFDEDHAVKAEPEVGRELLPSSSIEVANPSIVVTKPKKKTSNQKKSEFICAECQQRFDLEAELLVHEISHDMNARSMVVKKCPKCSYVTNGSTFVLVAHVMSKHTGERYRCPVDSCAYARTRKSVIKRHCMTQHTNGLSSEKPVRVSELVEPESDQERQGKFTNRRSSLRNQHRESRSVKPIACSDQGEIRSLCGDSMTEFSEELSDEDMNRIKKELHPKSPKTRRRKAANSRRNPEKLELLKYLVKLPSEETFECDRRNCKMKFPYKAKLLAHVIMKHSNSKPTIRGYQCNLCNVRKQVSSLASHLFTHTKESVYKCDFPKCAYQTYCLKRIKEHVNIHEINKHRHQIDSIINDKYERLEGQTTQLACGHEHCSEIFPFKAHLMSHIARNHSVGSESRDQPTIFRCTEENCDFESRVEYEVTNHMFSHTRENRYKCLQENCLFESVGHVDIRKHVMTHLKQHKSSLSPSKSWQCEVCGKSCVNSKAYSNHVNTHVKPYECTLCGRLFKLMQYCIRHRRSFHKIDPGIDEIPKKFRIESTETFPCDVEKCKQEFPFKALLLTHTSIDHSAHNSSSPTCHICHLKVDKKSSLEKHFVELHTKEKLFKCPTCEFSSIYFESLQDHMEHGETHHLRRVPVPAHAVPAKFKKLHCEICNRWFSSKVDLLNHKSIHSNDSPFQCDLCPKRFKCNSFRKSHCLRVHKLKRPTVQKNTLSEHLNGKMQKIIHTTSFACTEKGCLKVFELQAALSTHIQVDHVGKQRDSFGFHCGSCDYVISSRSLLQVHYHRHHTKEMVYKCILPNCTFTAVTSTEALKHLKTAAHGNPPTKLQCQHCGDFFKGPRTLSTHIKKNHEDNEEQ